ncbi:MAG: cell division protein FtsQ [Pseudomonadota bacterium]
MATHVQNAAPPQPPAPPRMSARAAGVALLLFLFLGLGSTVYAIVFQGLDLLPQGLTRAAFLDGATMRSMADALAKAPQARVAAEAERGTSWVLSGDLGPQVRQGCPGWLFLAEELAPHADGAAHAAARADVAVRLRAALEKKGIRLLVVVVPDKSRIEQSRLCGLQRPAALAGRLDDWTDRLRAAGVPVLDVTPVLAAPMGRGEDPFLRTDTHWNEAGAAASAQAVADAVKALGVERTPAQDYDVVQQPPARRPGDLVHLAGIDGLPLALQPAPETLPASSFTPRQAAGAVPAATGAATASSSSDADLFGDADLPRIALIGTSYSRNSHFADFLAKDLGTPVANLAKDGGNFWGAAEAYFASPAFKQTPPRLVVWEIPERSLQRTTAGERWTLP